MAMDQIQMDSAVGLGKTFIKVFAPPIVSRRNPTTRDKAQLGQMWVNRTTGITYILSAISANSYTWYAVAQAAASYTAAGALVAGTTLVVGTTATIGTGLTVSAGGAAITGNSTVTGSLSATTSVASGTTLTAGTSLAVTTSAVIGTNLTLTAGNLLLSAGNATLTNGNLVITAGNATLTNGELTISTAAKGITLPGAVRIMTGAGAPANGLATAIGCIYIRTDAAAAAERIYIATGVGAWSNVTCAA